MFSSVLIADRGENALRVARTCRDLGLGTVAVHSAADGDAAVVRFADAAVPIGPAASRHRHLHIPAVIEAAQATGVDAIHPGHGFLSEDPDFAEICAGNGMTFIGPPPAVMERLADKALMRRLMAEAGLPVLPGSSGPVDDTEQARVVAAGIGFPLVVKAVAGGGGRGITVVHEAEHLEAAYQNTRRTALGVFGDGAVYLERYLKRARHIEVQVLLDQHGHGVHLGERDCSVQRRHQALVEETPAAGLSPVQRRYLGALAVRGALAVGYTGVGTMEFLLDELGRFTFLEMNARVQAEHPVTEMVTGLDLVREQILVAAGQPLSITQAEVVTAGASIECRINAEPGSGPGYLSVFDLPGGPGVRVDTGYAAGAIVDPHHDPLLARIVTWGPDRETAIARMSRCLAELRVAGPGVATTRQLHQSILTSESFRSATHHTGFLAETGSPRTRPVPV